MPNHYCPEKKSSMNIVKNLTEMRRKREKFHIKIWGQLAAINYSTYIRWHFLILLEIGLIKLDPVFVYETGYEGIRASATGRL